MANGTLFVCQQCGFKSPKWMGRCPNCNSWASFVESFEEKGNKGTKKNKRSISPQYLNKIPKDSTKRTSTKIAELDNLLGGGLVPGQVSLLAGEPGIGKSTLVLQLADKIGNSLYVSGEESLAQIKIRAERLGVNPKTTAFVEETDIDVVLSSVREFADNKKPKLVIIDSIQTMYTADLNGIPGSVGQVRESSFRIIELAKSIQVPVIIIGHVTKQGAVAGPATLAHMVDTVLWFEGDRLNNLRILRSVKNRFASTDEVGIFQMGQNGLKAVSDTKLLFVGDERPKGVAGSVVSCVMEGTRPILVEIQALVTPSKLAIPRRVVQGIDSKRVELLIAVLIRHCGLKLADYDVFINIVGGMKVQDTGIDLGIALAIASSYKNKPFGVHTVVVGEVGLLGEIRAATHERKRVEHAKRQGFAKSISSASFKKISAVIKAR